MTVLRRMSPGDVAQLWRYAQVGVVNTAIGFGLYALLVWLGLDRFVAQIIAHCCGVAFNYASYGRHVFRLSEPAKLRFAGAYVLNYLVGLAALASVSLAVPSPYAAGALAVLVAAAINYVVLKRLVFTATLP